MRGFILGVFLTIFVILAGGFLFVRSGKLSMATTAPPLPLEKTIAQMAIQASMGNAKEQKSPLPLDDTNLLAGAKVYKGHCAGCHGLPQQPRRAMTKAMFPPPPQLMVGDDMVTDDPEGETYWKVTNGIRLSGMPGFGPILSDIERWQVTMMLSHADKLPSSVQEEFAQQGTQH